MKIAELYEQITAKIITAIEAGASGKDWRAPWHYNGAADTMSPTNAATNKPYRGANIIVLAMSAMDKEYPTGVWATYNQWTALDAQVRKGEKTTYAVKWVVKKAKDAEGAEPGTDDEGRQRMVPVCFKLFNAAQVDGWVPPEPIAGAADPIEHADAFFASIGAKVTEGSNRACYQVSNDTIVAPALSQYDNPADYYSTLGHEHIHWTGAESRLDRLTQGKFGSADYAKEELVAEMGAAFLCGRLHIANEPRPDHAQYLASWLKVLKSDPKVLMAAASHAQKAVDFLTDLADENTNEINRSTALPISA